MIAALLALAIAYGASLDGLSDLARGSYERGQDLEQRGEYSSAAAAYRVVWRTTPGWTRALIDEARVLALDGRLDDALKALDRSPYDADVLEARGRLLLEEGRSEEAAEAFRQLPPEWPDGQLLVASALAADDPLAADTALRRYLDRPGELDVPAVVALAPVLVLALDAIGDEDRAYELAGFVLDRVGHEEGLEVLDEKKREQDVGKQAKALASAAAQDLNPTSVLWLREARALLFAGEVEAARVKLATLTEAQPRATEAWSARSIADERAGDIAGAVFAARTAESLDPVDAELSARVGQLLAAHYGGRMDVAAARAYGEAVQRRGADADLWWRKAELERRVGWSTSVRSYERVLELAPGTELARRAQDMLDQLSRPIPPEVQPLDGEELRPPSVPEPAWDALHRAWAWQRRDEPDALDHAREEIQDALSMAPRWDRAINLSAAIHLDAGDDAEALAQYRESLEVDPDQGAVWLVVGALLRQQGDVDAAREAEARAAALGEPEALLVMAQRHVEGWDLRAAWADLRRYRERSVTSPERVAELERAVQVRAAGLALGASFGVVALLATPLWWVRRRRSGVGLDAVLRRDARSFPEVARILAAMRHEVIKHHTTVLDAVADALERGDDGPAEWAEERLFGKEGAVPTFYLYLGELEALAERQGLRLNLRHGDAELAPVVDAMDALKATEGRLARQTPAHLRQLSEALNGHGYRALGRRVRELCQQGVDADFVREAWRLACRELGDDTPFEVEVDEDDGPLVVRVFRQDLLDVLVNVLRNAVQANEATGGGRVGVRVEVEDDWVTGLERVVIQVRDDSLLRLDTEQLRGRFLGRGLGLAVDRVTQAGGSMHVEEADGWAKAVVIRLPRLEVEADDDDDEGPWSKGPVGMGEA